MVPQGREAKNVSTQTVQSANNDNTGGAYVMRTHNQDSKRSYDKVAYCLYCSNPQKKLPQHLPQHKNEAEVAEYLAVKSGERRQRLLTVIRNRGNHKHNCEVIAEFKTKVDMLLFTDQAIMLIQRIMSHVSTASGGLQKLKCGSTSAF